MRTAQASGGEEGREIPGMVGISIWDTFKNNSAASAARYPSLSVYVDDRNGKTEVVEKGAQP
jgi:hypothetical protein